MPGSCSSLPDLRMHITLFAARIQLPASIFGDDLAVETGVIGRMATQSDDAIASGVSSADDAGSRWHSRFSENIHTLGSSFPVPNLCRVEFLLENPAADLLPQQGHEQICHQPTLKLEPVPPFLDEQTQSPNRAEAPEAGSQFRTHSAWETSSQRLSTRC